MTGINFGRRPRGVFPVVSRLFAVIGDSLTERAFGSTPIYWQNGLLGAPLQLIANCGHSGQSIYGLIGQIERAYTEATAPGMIGLPALGVVGLRIGTNTARGAEGSTGIPLNESNEGYYVTIIDRLLDFAEHVVIFPVPPIGGSVLAKNTAVAGYNTYLQGLVSADTTGRLHWIDDCADLVDGSGNILPQFFISDELHMNGPGGYQMALTAESALTALMVELYGTGWAQSRLVTDAADVYPAQPQWTTNPTNTGTGGTLGSGWTGSCPTGWNVQTNGAAQVGTVGIVAADGGDPNTVPWVRITPTTSAASAIAITMTGAGRTIASGDPAALEHLAEIRFNGMTHYYDLTLWLQSGGSALAPASRLRWGSSIGVNNTVTVQQKHYRTNGSAGTPVNYIYIAGADSYTGDMGSVDIRCWSVRG